MLKMTLWTLKRRGAYGFVYPLPQGAMYGAGLWTRGQGNFPWLTGQAVPAQSMQEVATSAHQDESRLTSLAARGRLFVSWDVSGGGGMPKASLLLPHSGFLWSSGAAWGFVARTPWVSVCCAAVGCWKGRASGSSLGNPASSGGCYFPFALCPPQEKTSPGGERTQLLWGKA